MLLVWMNEKKWTKESQEDCLYLHAKYMYCWCDKEVSKHINFFSPMGQQPLLGQGRLINEATRSHSDTRRPVVETSLPYNTQNPQERDIHAPAGFRTYNPRNRGDADPRLRTRGHCNWLKYINKYVHNNILQHLSPIHDWTDYKTNTQITKELN
jgi:hypothetical protein